MNEGSHSGTNRGRDRRKDIGRDKGFTIAISLALPYHRIAGGEKNSYIVRNRKTTLSSSPVTK
jgi:hypothetical protein